MWILCLVDCTRFCWIMGLNLRKIAHMSCLQFENETNIQFLLLSSGQWVHWDCKQFPKNMYMAACLLWPNMGWSSLCSLCNLHFFQMSILKKVHFLMFGRDAYTSFMWLLNLKLRYPGNNRNLLVLDALWDNYALTIYNIKLSSFWHILYLN